MSGLSLPKYPEPAVSSTSGPIKLMPERVFLVVMLMVFISRIEFSRGNDLSPDGLPEKIALLERGF
jgi:hypothetical protein